MTPGAVARGRLRIVMPRAWTIWRCPARQIGYLLAVEVAAMVLVVASLVVVPIHRSDVVLGLIILAVAVLHIEASGPIERIRDRSAPPPHLNLDTTWTFAATILVHPAVTALIIVVTYLLRWIRTRHHVVHRQVFNAASVVLVAYSAVAVLALTGHFRDFPDMPRDTGSFFVVLAAGLAFAVANLALVAGAIALSTSDRKLRRLTPGWESFALGLASIGMGVLVAWALVDWPIFLTVIFGISLVSHGMVLQPQLRTAANTDAKTGLLNHSGWISAARQELGREQQAGVLMIDLDLFKLLNDAHGHLFGDEVLQHVANAISAELRGSDLGGRFGGEEFIVLVPGASEEGATAVAERIRRGIAALEIPVDDTSVTCTASIGVAVHPQHGRTLDDLIAAADRAAYAAKAAGRNQVRHFAAGSG